MTISAVSESIVSLEAKIEQSKCGDNIRISISQPYFRLRCKTGRALGKMIKTVSTLEELNLEDNEIGEEGATAIALGIQCETAKLKSLNISQNIIGDNGGIGTYLKYVPNSNF